MCLSSRAARKAVGLVMTLLMSAYMLSGWAIAHANPIILWDLQGKVFVTENGRPSNKVSSIALSCQHQVYERRTK